MKSPRVNVAAVALQMLLVLLFALSATHAFAQGAINSGETVTGTISPAGHSDSWTFTASIGDAIVIRVGEITQSGNFSPRIRLFSPTASQLATSSGAVGAEIAFTATTAGTHTIVVDDALNTATGTYRLTLAKTGAAVVVSAGDTGGPMTNGAMHAGTIDVGDLDVWTVSAAIGERIVVRMGKINPAAAFTPQLRIYGPNGGAFLSSSSFASGAEVEVSATVAGNYMVLAGDFSAGYQGSGDYRLTLAKTGSPVSVSQGDQGGALSNGAMHTGTIDVGDLDVWTVDAIPGDRILVRAGKIAANAAFTPQLRIYSPTGGAALDSQAFAQGAEVEVTAPAAGTYLVVVGDASSGYSGAGDYRLTLAKTGSPVSVSQGDQGGPLTNGAMHTGTIDVGDLDVWTVDALPGDRIVVRMGKILTNAAFAPQLRIYSPAGGAALDGESFAQGAEVEVTAPAAGTYLVVVSDFSAAYAGSGDYRLTLAKTGSPVVVSPGDQGGPMTNGLMHLGTIDVGDLDVWTVDAVAGQRIVVRMGKVGAIVPQLRIYSPAGGAALDGESFANGAEVEVTANATGQFLVVASDLSGAYSGSGDYRLTLAKTGSPVLVSPGDEGGPLINGAMHTGNLDIGDLDVWTVDAVAGQAIVVRMGKIGAIAPQLRIYSPAGGAALDGESFASGAEIAVTAPATGTYLVVASDFTAAYAGSGAYRLTLAKTGSPVIVSPGDQGGALTNGPHPGVIDIGDLDVWTIRANAGDHLVISMTEVIAGSGLSPQLRLYAPTGGLLASNVNATTAQLTVTVASTGTYLLVAGDLSTAYTGSGQYVINGSGATGFPATPTLDIDASNTQTKYDALTDGLLVIRYLFGLSGEALTSGALGATATRTTSDALLDYLDSIRGALDVDLNGTADPMTDGVLLIRYLLDFRDAALVDGAVDLVNGTRKDATDIATYIQSLMP